MKETDSFKSVTTQTLCDYWFEKRGDRERPRYSDIDLMDLFKIAPFICIRDVIDGGDDFHCRYWGTGLADTYKLDCTGKALSSTYGVSGRKKIFTVYTRAINAQQPLRLLGNLDYPDQSIFSTFESIMLPLDGRDDERQHVIAAFEFSYQMDGEDRQAFEEDKITAHL